MDLVVVVVVVDLSALEAERSLRAGRWSISTV
jgi:hypothetical protein